MAIINPDNFDFCSNSRV